MISLINFVLVLCFAAFVSAVSLVGSLILFVSIYTLASLSFILHSVGVFVGLSHLVVYTGAITVLFVFVVLLVENQHLNLTSTVQTSQVNILTLVSALGLSSAVVSLAPSRHYFAVLGLEQETDLSGTIGVSLYGENLAGLILVGLVLVMATAGPIALCLSPTPRRFVISDNTKS